MTAKGRAVASWTLAGLLFVAAAVCLNDALASWYFADFHNEYSRAYASRGNRLFLLAGGFLAGFVLVVIRAVRGAKKRKSDA